MLSHCFVHVPALGKTVPVRTRPCRRDMQGVYLLTMRQKLGTGVLYMGFALAMIGWGCLVTR